jgi:GH25 family lysozyme M1 (1,4-beta-N-acetylmuramidase)
MTTMPVPKGFVVTSPYGPRWGTIHYGVDYGVAGGAGGKPIYAVKDGTVVQSGPASGFGQWIRLDHPASNGGGESVYGHIIPEVTTGQQVREGQRIGRINPDSATNGGVAPHLHIEFYKYSWVGPAQRVLGQTILDPQQVLRGAKWPGETSTTAPAPAPAKGHILGVDVSYYQNGMSLKRAAGEGLSFAIIRTSDGTLRDWAYQSHIRDAESAGMVTAAYHFCRNPNEGTSITQQVATSVDVMGAYKRPIWLDCETPAGLFAQHVQEFKNEFERRGVRVIGIYSYIPWWEGKTIGGEPATAPYGKVWLAHYGSNPDGSPAQVYAARGGNNSRYWDYPLGNQKPVLFQYGSKAEVAGFADVDVNAFRGSKQQLKDLFYGTTTKQEEELELSDIDKKRIKLSLDQFAGPGTNSKGEPTYNGWDFKHLVEVANNKLTQGKGLTLVEMVARTMDKQNNQEGAINRLSESLDELIKAVTALNDAVAQLAGANPEVK